jgi:hypothetical protein
VESEGFRSSRRTGGTFGKGETRRLSAGVQGRSRKELSLSWGTQR